MRIIDLSSPIDANAEWEPNTVTHDVMSPAQGAAHMIKRMRDNWGLELDQAVLPEGELLSLDTLTLTTHTGTHVDAPSHYGSSASYGTPKHIDQMPLDWFLRPGFLLDLTECPIGTVDASWLKREFDRIGLVPERLDIVLLNTGSSAYAGTSRYFTDFVGLDGSATNLLLDLGVRVIGTDAFSLDAPFSHMIMEYQRSADPAVLWPAHFAGRDREYCQIERLANLDTLSAATGFQIACFPVKIAGAGAGWARAVALVED
jgi:kynurenine formamidase